MDKYKVFRGDSTMVEESLNKYAEQGYTVLKFECYQSSNWFFGIMELPDALYKPDPTTDTHSAFDGPDVAPVARIGTCPVKGCEENIGHKSVIRVSGEVLHI